MNQWVSTRTNQWKSMKPGPGHERINKSMNQGTKKSDCDVVDMMKNVTRKLSNKTFFAIKTAEVVSSFGGDKFWTILYNYVCICVSIWMPRGILTCHWKLWEAGGFPLESATAQEKSKRFQEYGRKVNQANSPGGGSHVTALAMCIK